MNRTPMLKFSNDPDLAEQQMCAIIFYLTAFGYIDGDFDPTEKTFVKLYIRQLVEARARDAMPDASAELRSEVVTRFVTHFHEVFEVITHEIQQLFSEVVAKDENLQQFVYAKLKLRSYEIFRSFDEVNRRELLLTIDELINADGKVHPAEVKFRDELQALLQAAVPTGDVETARPAEIQILEPARIQSSSDNHPVFSRFEQHYSADPVRIRKQADADHQLILRAMQTLDEQREAGDGKLVGKTDISQFVDEQPFLDGHVYVHPIETGQRYELTVLGDLHGCYSCLKAALLQSNFFAKLEAHRLDPRRTPRPLLIFLGDYIDRGQFSYNGVLRTVMQLFLTAPDHVYMLRGNHEFYIEYGGRIYGGVKPAEAINTLINHMPKQMFEAYMRLFEAMPNVLLLGRTMFVHAGIPRDSALRDKWVDLSSLNDPDLRFQMMWSDPSQAEFIPDGLQEQNARFPFGRIQFERFMARLGTNTMVRGHEKILEGFRATYADGNAVLLNVFSAGGANNGDLPHDSSYREVTPMAVTIRIDGDSQQVIPWEIDYERFNHPERNAFFASAPEIQLVRG